MEQDANQLSRALQELNRTIPRASLRGVADAVRAAGPGATPPAELEAAALREELAALSTFFIAELWGHLARYLEARGCVLASPSPRGDGFEPLASLAGAADPVVEVCVRVETLLVSFGRFTEHAAAPTPALRRYRELLGALPPAGAHTPTSHGAGNALAGLQIALALAEVAPRAFASRRGRAMTRDELDALIGGAPFEQLLHAIGASSARVSNALLAALCPDRFAAWGHSLLAMPPGERSARRLAFDPAMFVAEDARLDVAPEPLARLRALAGDLETPGRTHQLTCPAFAAPAAGGHVFGAFTRWLVAIARAYLVPLWA